MFTSIGLVLVAHLHEALLLDFVDLFHVLRVGVVAAFVLALALIILHFRRRATEPTEHDGLICIVQQIFHQDLIYFKGK